MNEIFEKIGKIGIVPVIKIDDAEKAIPLANALIRGGLPVAEVTFRTEEAAEAISRISEKFPEMLCRGRYCSHQRAGGQRGESRG